MAVMLPRTPEERERFPLGIPIIGNPGFLPGGEFTPEGRANRQAGGGSGGFNSLGGFSPTGMTGEVERARFEMVEQMKRVKANKGKSRLSFPQVFPEVADITKDVL